MLNKPPDYIIIGGVAVIFQKLLINTFSSLETSNVKYKHFDINLRDIGRIFDKENTLTS